ncbi:hypothetical protein VTH82DRAFT_2437 [Thermothelomyces myriococcoides]
MADPIEQFESLPLLSRAWAYQERLLSPRVLHFGPQEVLWECAQLLDCDCGGAAANNAEAAAPRHMSTYASRDTSGLLPPKVSHYAALYLGGVVATAARTKKSKKKTAKVAEPKRRRKLLARWEEMVGEYTHRSLTFPSDRLPAFSGVAAEMIEVLGGSARYLAGQWEETLPAALLYERTNGSDPARLRIDDPRPAPSWSWASVDGPVHFFVPLAGSPAWAHDVVHAVVRDARCVPAGPDERGRVVRHESFLTLETELVPVVLCFDPGHPRLDPDRRCVPIRDAVARGEKGPKPVPGRFGRDSFMVRAKEEAAVQEKEEGKTKVKKGKERVEGEGEEEEEEEEEEYNEADHDEECDEEDYYEEHEEEEEEEWPRPPPEDPMLYFVPDVQLCDERGEWLWDGSDETCCAKITVSPDHALWLVLRRLPADGDGDGDGDNPPLLYERIGVVYDSNFALPSSGVKTCFRII